MLSILYILSIVTTSELSAESNGPKIVSGRLAIKGQYPYQVSLRLNNRHFCGGSIIKKQWILTAAQCLSGFNDTAIDVVVGTNTLDKGGDKYASIKRIIHPFYNSTLNSNDIGLIQVDKDIVFGEKVKPIALPTSTFDKSGYPATLSGWGTTSFPGDTPNKLYHTQLTVIDQKDCLKTSFRVTNNNICTLNKQGESACHGDSGGPLVADNQQIGVASWGKPCAESYPDVFTRVSSYFPWINEHAK